MIGTALEFFRHQLNDYLKGTAAEPKVVFLPTQSGESIHFPPDAITLLLINIEQDETTRKADPYIQKNGSEFFKVLPEIRLNLYLLFVANWGEHYNIGLERLSWIIRFFQANKVFVFGETNQPELYQDGIEKLSVELVTLPFAQQNEVWNALRTYYRPSALFKVRMIVFQQEVKPADQLKDVKTIEERFSILKDGKPNKDQFENIKIEKPPKP